MTDVNLKEQKGWNAASLGPFQINSLNTPTRVGKLRQPGIDPQSHSEAGSELMAIYI